MTDPAGLRDEPSDVTVTASDVPFHGRVWDIRRDTFTYDGADIVREYVAHTGATAIVAVDDDDRVLLIQQYRHPIRTRDWEIPAGLLDVPGEPVRDAAERELAEEADLRADRWELLTRIHTTPGGSDETVHIWLARGLHATPAAFDRSAEEADIRVAWMPLQAAVDAVLDGRMHNGILAVGVLAAAERVRRAATPAVSV